MTFTQSIVLGLVAAVVIWSVLLYNQLVALKLQVANAFAQIDVQLKRRFDLVPNLVEVAKKYMQHERETLEAVMVARNQAWHATRAAAAKPGEASAMQALFGADSGLSGRLAGFMAVAEGYPELKADASMKQLSEELSSTENRVGFARQSYNDAVMVYNTALEQFPNNILAGLFSLQPSRILEATTSAQERQVVRVQL